MTGLLPKADVQNQRGLAQSRAEMCPLPRGTAERRVLGVLGAGEERFSGDRSATVHFGPITRKSNVRLRPTPDVASSSLHCGQWSMPRVSIDRTPRLLIPLHLL